MTDSQLAQELRTRGFDGAGYKYTQNSPVGGYAFIVLLDGHWTEINLERGELFINKTFAAEREAQASIAGLLAEGKIEHFGSPDEMYM